MSIDSSELRSKILGLYPEIEKNGIELKIEFSDEKESWIVTMVKNGETLFTHLETEDANQCLVGKKCFYLENQIMGFIDAYCSSSSACST